MWQNSIFKNILGFKYIYNSDEQIPFSTILSYPLHTMIY